MDVEHMREFIAVADEQSFTTAAERLFVNQPVLSKHIHSIETTLRTKLIIRSPKGLTLTPLGREAYSAFSDIVRRYDDLVASLGEHDGLSGQLRVGMLTMGVDDYVLPATTRFAENYPNVNIAYSTEKPKDIVSGIVDGKLDIGFAAEGKYYDKGVVTYHLIGLDAVRIAVPLAHPAAHKDRISPEDVADSPLVCLRYRESTDELNGLLFSIGFKPTRIVQIDELELAPSSICAVNGYFAIPDFMCSAFDSFKNVRVLDLETPVFLPIFFAYRTATDNPIVPLFINSLEKTPPPRKGLADLRTSHKPYSADQPRML